MKENTVFFRNIPFDFSGEEFTNKMRLHGRVMFVRYVKKNDQFNGSAFVRFSKKEDLERLFEIDEKLKNDPESRAIVDINSIFMIKERILHIFRPVQKDSK